MSGLDERLTFTPIRDEDQEFLYLLYASTREEELRPVPWSPAEKIDFLKMQFKAQHQHYMGAYDNASFELILLDGERIGRLYVDRRESEIRVVDIAIVPEMRGQGIGKHLMLKLIQEAASAAKPLNIHVENYNPAQRLYQRLGFRKVGETGVYHLMQKDPESVVEKQTVSTS